MVKSWNVDGVLVGNVGECFRRLGVRNELLVSDFLNRDFCKWLWC